MEYASTEVLIQKSLKKLDKTVKQTKYVEIGFKEIALEVKHRMKKVPFYVPPVLFLFWLCYKFYLKFGFFSFLSFGVTMAISTNMVILAPRLSERDKEIKPELKIIAAESPRIKEAVVGINAAIQEKKIGIEAKDDKISIIPLYKSYAFKMKDGSVLNGLLIDITEDSYVVMSYHQKPSYLDKYAVISLR